MIKIYVSLVALILSFIGIFTLSILSKETYEIIAEPAPIIVIGGVSVFLWLKAAAMNQGSIKSFLFMMLFGCMSPFCGAFLSGIILGFFTGAIGALIVTSHWWYVVCPFGIITGLIVFVISKPVTKVVASNIETENV
jgi:hypothetical protein